jgi:parvulin-like peptidyl-prolyl isomerase
VARARRIDYAAGLVGAKSGQNKKPPAAKGGRAAGRQRLALILFGAVFVALFVGFAVAQGLSGPSVPSGDAAVVSGVADDISNISEADYKVALAQQVASGELKKLPKPGSQEEEAVREAIVGQLLESVWIQGEAEELDISVTDKQIETELAQIKKSNWPTPVAYKEFLKTSKLTQEEVNEKVELQLLGTKIQELISAAAPPPSNSEIADNYEENKATAYTTKPNRDVRLIFNKDKAEAEAALKKLEADDSPANWKAVAKKYSEETTSSAKGGLQTGVTEELLQTAPTLKTAIFGAATGELGGPIKFQNTYVVFEVEELHGKKVQTLGEVRAQISAQLSEQVKQKYFGEFVTNFQNKWTARTTCASDFESPRCSNYSSARRIAKEREQYEGCYEANPKVPPKACPAPVLQTKPALPGSVTLVKPEGEQLAQRPLPEAAPESAKEAAAEKVKAASEAAGE